MARISRRLFLVTAAAGLTLASVGLVAFRDHTRNDLTVVNRSGLTIQFLEVSFPWETLRIDQLADGGAASRSFRIEFDAHFEMTGRLGDGSLIRSSQGYVTNGQYGEVVLIEVGRHGVVEVRQRQRPALQGVLD